MGRENWVAADLDAEIEWLGGDRSDGAMCGFDPSGWEASIWVLHAMFELPGVDADLTYDEAHRARVAAGLEEPDMVGDVNLSELTTQTGGQLGLTSWPGPEWIRLRWRELALRLGIDLGDSEHPPCFRWFPYRSWPVAIEPPCAGSLDAVSLEALLVHLDGASPERDCIATYAIVAAGPEPGVRRCFRGPVGAIRGLVDERESRIGTPSNFWPVDKAWFVYTDWDLWATKVSGSRDLVERLVADPRIETLQWPWPARRLS